MRARNHPLLVDRKPLGVALPPGLLAALLRLLARLGLLVHAARLQLRTALQALQPRNLLAQRFVLRAKTGVLFQNLQHQALQACDAQLIDIPGQIDHAP